jgi:hypothetical protein
VTPQEYAEAQAAITAATAAYVLTFSKLFVNPLLTLVQWVGLLQLLFPEVQRARYESANLARGFYDSQRLQAYPDIPRHDVYLETYDFKSFVKNMEPSRKRMSMPQAPADSVTSMVLQTVREVDNAGRQQIIHSVEADTELFTQAAEQPAQAPATESITDYLRQQLANDQFKRNVAETAGKSEQPAAAPRVIRGWARVATGKETCGWCLMLISRGPTYMDSNTAGLSIAGWEAEPMISAGEDVSEYMNEWHIGCDCKVMPVYKLEDWAGAAAAKRALEMYNEATDDAIAWAERYPDRVHLSGKKKGKPFTRSEDIVLALRRRLESGAITTQEYAALAA